MRAAVRDRYGSPGAVVDVRDVPKPTAGEGQLLVRVRAAALNRGDWYSVTGTPWIGRPRMGLRRPKDRALGADYAGTVEAVGEGVTGFRPGDEVFGARTGALAEYVVARADRAVATKPAHVSLEEAAAVPVAAITALQGLRDHGGLQPGHKVLINGASGGVGTFAVPIAKALGAEVTAVCRTRNVETARTLGADHVVDYLREDFTQRGERYDVLLDVAGGRSWSECRRVLHPEGTLVIVGAPAGNRVIGPLGHVVRLRLASLRDSRRAVFFIAKLDRADLEFLRDLLADGRLAPVVDRVYALDEAAEALAYVGEGHCRAKVVVTL